MERGLTYLQELALRGKSEALNAEEEVAMSPEPAPLAQSRTLKWQKAHKEKHAENQRKYRLRKKNANLADNSFHDENIMLNKSCLRGPRR